LESSLVYALLIIYTLVRIVVWEMSRRISYVTKRIKRIEKRLKKLEGKVKALIAKK